MRFGDVLPATRRSRPGPLRWALVAAVVVGAATVLQAGIAVINIRWYAGLVRPSISPPPGLAAVGAVILAALLAVGFFRVLNSPDYLPDRPRAIRSFLIGLFLDILWAWLFFAGRHPTVALMACGLLTTMAAIATWNFALVDRRAALLLSPWIGATSFAFLLDLSIALRNG